MEVRPAKARTGEQVTVRVTVRDGSGVLLGVQADFGDGGRAAQRFTAACDSGSAPPAADRTVELTHRYERAGAYPVVVTARTGDCGAEPERRTARGSVEVLASAGPTPSNGGALPAVRMGQPRPVDGAAPRTVGLRLAAVDTDGYVTRLVVDWGDGTEPVAVTYPLSECRTADSGYPSSRRETSLQHTYAQDGQYAVRVQAVSVGCAGGDEQVAHARGRVVVPTPSPSPRPSRSS